MGHACQVSGGWAPASQSSLSSELRQLDYPTHAYLLHGHVTRYAAAFLGENYDQSFG